MDERGASAVEYGLLIAGIAALIVVVVFAFGANIKDVFDETCQASPRRDGAASADRPARPRQPGHHRAVSCRLTRLGAA